MSMLGVWMWPQNVRKYGAQKVVSYCVRSGVTDIFFLTKGLAGTAAYHSHFAPQDCETDLLGDLLAAAHKRGVRVHAWLTSASDEHYKALYPQSGRCHYTRGKDRGLIALADEGYLAYMENIVSEICTDYDVDGLHLDYIRYNHLLYGWEESDLARYKAQGADIARLRTLMDRTFIAEDKDEQCIFNALRAGDESAKAFARARRQDVYRFASTLTSLARAKKSGIILSAALMPEGAYADTTFADLHYGQSYEDAATLYDYALPMAYANAYGKDSAWVREVAVGTMERGLKTIVGVHAYEGGTGPSLQADIAALQDTGAAGVCLFREGACAFAYASGKQLDVLNTLEKPVTRLCAIAGGETLSLDAEIAPGAQQTFALPFEAQTLRAYAGDTDICAYLTQEHNG